MNAPAPVSVRLFGDFQLSVGNTPLKISKKGQWLLAYVILRGCAAPAADVLEAVFPSTDEPPTGKNPKKQLTERSRKHYLRREMTAIRDALAREARRSSLSDECDCLPERTSDGGPVVFLRDKADIDVTTFDRLLVRKGEAEELWQAMDLYRAPLLLKCDALWAMGEREKRAEDFRRAAFRLAVEFHGGERPEDAISILRRLLSEEPEWEPGVRALMELYEAHGQRAAGIGVYRAFAQRLKRENLLPSSETLALYHRLRHSTTPPGNLPAKASSLIGREELIKAVEERFQSEKRLVTLTGPGGVGKTRLAIAVATAVGAGFKNGAWIARLEGLTELATEADIVSVLYAALAPLELKPASSKGVAPSVALGAALRKKSLLLILDNCEHILDACAPVIVALMENAPGLHLLATSQQPIGLLANAEQLQPVAPLNPSAAYDLFEERARAAHPTFRASRANESDIRAICDILDGIPLFLEMAAAQASQMSPAAIRKGLRETLLKGDRTAPPKQRKAEGVFRWSYGLLTAELQGLLTRLSVFRGGFTLASAEIVCGATAVGLKELTKCSLLSEGDFPANGATRYRLLEIIRRFAAQELTLRREDTAVLERHRDAYLALAEAAESQLTGNDQASWLRRLETEHDNLNAALEWRNDSGALRLAGALWRFWYVRGHFGEGRKRLTAALAGLDNCGRTLERAKALRGAGVLARSQADFEAAQTLYEECLEIYRENDDRRGVASTLSGLGNVWIEQGRYKEGRRVIEEGLVITRDVGDRQDIATALNNLGIVLQEQGDYEDARALGEETLAIYREVGDGQGIANALNNLGIVAQKKEDYAAARTFFERSLAAEQELGNKQGIAISLANLAVCSERQGDHESSRTFNLKSLSVCQEIGDILGIAISLEGIAGLFLVQKDVAKAAQLYGAGEGLREGIGSPLPPDERPHYDQQVAKVRAALGKETFPIVWQEGRALTTKKAIALALSTKVIDAG